MPQTQLAIAVDTAFVAGHGGKRIASGIYVTDNQLNDGSTGEASMSLHTRCNVGSLIGFTSYPIDVGSGDSVTIAGFSVVRGNVFDSSGYPLQQTPSYWIGQAMLLGSQTYEIQLCITAGALRPVKFYVSTECQLTAH